MNITDYLASRSAESLDETKENLLAASEALDAAGAAIDLVLRRGEAAQAGDAERRNLVEETVQTLNALSREVWNAERAARETLKGLAQLATVERRLALSVAANAAVDADQVAALDDARASLKAIEDAIASRM